jgi:hypothetical protein
MNFAARVYQPCLALAEQAVRELGLLPPDVRAKLPSVCALQQTLNTLSNTSLNEGGIRELCNTHT